MMNFPVCLLFFLYALGVRFALGGVFTSLPPVVVGMALVPPPIPGGIPVRPSAPRPRSGGRVRGAGLGSISSAAGLSLVR